VPTTGTDNAKEARQYMAEDTGSGAPEGGEEGKDKSKDDFVPKTQFLAALKSANEKYDALKADLEAKLEAAKAAPKVEAPKRYTRAELTAMVDSRQINQEQADAQLDYQVREDAKADAQRVALETVTSAERKRYVDAEIGRYKAVAPEILDDASETRERIKEEYNFLVGTLGDPNGLDTQLKAIRSVLGPVEKLERARNAKSGHESHRETGGGGGASEGGTKGDVKLTYANLSSREKAHYDKLISSGIYKDVKAVNEELAYSNPTTRRKYGAMN
jgi:hypothetical protein